MHLVPIPTTDEYLRATAHQWLPFLERISKRSREPIADLVQQVLRFEVQPILVWDGNQAVALVGVRRHRRGADLIADLVWMTGSGREAWEHLLSELERYLKEDGCVAVRPVCRPGWSRLLKQHGYKTTHYCMEKIL